MNDRVTTSLVRACVLGACVAVHAYAAPDTSDQSAGPVSGISGDAQSASNLVETRITSEQLEYDYAEKIIYLRGNVVVTDPRGTLKSDNATVYFEKEKEIKENTANAPTDTPGAFKSVMATGNVRMISGTRMAVSDKAVWTYKDDRIVLTGDNKQRPLVREMKDGKELYMLTADRIIYNVKTQKFEFQPNVNVVLQPTPADQARFLDHSTETKPAAGNEKK